MTGECLSLLNPATGGQGSIELSSPLYTRRDTAGRDGKITMTNVTIEINSESWDPPDAIFLKGEGAFSAFWPMTTPHRLLSPMYGFPPVTPLGVPGDDSNYTRAYHDL